MAEIEKIREDFKDQVELVLVYIKEAHSGDEWQMDSNVESKVVFDQPKTFEARTDLARTFPQAMASTLPLAGTISTPTTIWVSGCGPTK